MDRATVYTQEQGRSVDFLFAQRSTMIGLGKLAQAALGSNTVVRGLAVTPNSPAALNVLVGIGEIYSTAQVDANPWGALTADTTDVIVKQGLNMAAQTISTPAPTTSGYSVAYLIEAQYQDQDTNAAVLPYYNSTNPQLPLNGQGGNGAPQATQRQGLCVIQAKAGIAAPTGTQVTPSVDSGWTALAVVTVANGQATVTAGNISIPAGVPQVTSLLQMMQTGSTEYAIDTSSTANQIVIALTPPLTSYTDGQPLNFQAANTCTGPCNINAGPGNIALNGAAGAFQGNEIIAGKFYEAVYRANTGTAVIVGQSGGAQQINPATQSQHAVQLGQVTNTASPLSLATATPTQPTGAAQFQQIGNFQGQISVTTTTTLTSSIFGSYVSTPSGNAGGYTITLPSAAGNAGKSFAFLNAANAAVTLSSGNFNSAYGSATTTISVPAAGSVVFECDGTSYNAIGGSGAVGIAPRPNGATGPGNLVAVQSAVTYALPAGGSWFYSIQTYASGGANQNSNTGVAAGGTTIFTASGNYAQGFAWRIQ